MGTGEEGERRTKEKGKYKGNLRVGHVARQRLVARLRSVSFEESQALDSSRS